MTTIELIAPEHFEIVAKWLSQPAINRWLTAEWRNRAVTPGIVAMAVRNRKNRLFLVRWEGRSCGLSALADIDIADATAMVWYVLGESELAGRGIMSEAVRQLALKSFAELGLQSLYAWAMADNVWPRRG